MGNPHFAVAGIDLTLRVNGCTRLRLDSRVTLLDALREHLGLTGKGLGEIGVVGVSAAIANAAYHATGRRIRSLPITVEQLL
jgi:aerobic-type carbon monoxide dehydrogenase small subunit (CoxS/CutS family)